MNSQNPYGDYALPFKPTPNVNIQAVMKLVSSPPRWLHGSQQQTPFSRICAAIQESSLPQLSLN
jgi:hypothetical protein